MIGRLVLLVCAAEQELAQERKSYELGELVLRVMVKQLNTRLAAMLVQVVER